MPNISSGYIMGYHSCDKELGMRLVNGKDELLPSTNAWDWLGKGIYFWENDPARALQYATENAAGIQKNRKAAKTPFVIGAVIDLGKCLNLVEIEALEILSEAHKSLANLMEIAEDKMPVNNGNNRALDCAVMNYIHESNVKNAYHSIRCAFLEGEGAYEGSNISSRSHIQLCVRSHHSIAGYFLPKPVSQFNPYI